jgi:hypothetical protein
MRLVWLAVQGLYPVFPVPEKVILQSGKVGYLAASQPKPFAATHSQEASPLLEII